MNKSSKIRRVIQKIAIILAVIMALPQTPMAQSLGLGYVEAHAEPQAKISDYDMSLDTYIVGNKLIIKPYFYGMPDDSPTPEGKISYEYQIVEWDATDDDIKDTYAVLASNVDISSQYEWSCEDYLGKMIIIRWSYTGDDNYESYSNYDLENYYYNYTRLTPPKVSNPILKKMGSNYYLTFKTKNIYNIELPSFYYYLITPYDNGSYDAFSPEDLSGLVQGYDEEKDTYYGTGGITWDEGIDYDFEEYYENNITLNLGEIPFKEELYICQVITSDETNFEVYNYSNTEITPVFMTYSFSKEDFEITCAENLVYQGTDLTPEITFTAKGEDEKRKQAASTWIVGAKTSGQLSFYFKKTKEWDGTEVSTAVTGSAIKAAGTYDVYISGSYYESSVANEFIKSISVARNKTNPISFNLSADVTGESQQAVLKVTITGEAGIAAPTGTVKYEYSVDGGTSWQNIISVNLSDLEYLWTNTELKGYEVLVRATYSGDGAYNEATDQTVVDFAAPDLTAISEISRKNTDYSFAITSGTKELLQKGRMYYLLTLANTEGYADTTAESIVASPSGSIEFAYSAKNSGFENSFTVSGDTLTPGASYVIQAVIVDLSGNISNKVVSEAFTIPTTYTSADITAAVTKEYTYTGMVVTPKVILSVSESLAEDKKATVDAWIKKAVTEKRISFSFKQIKDGDGKNVSSELKTVVTNAGTYEIYATVTDDECSIKNQSIGTFIIAKAATENPEGSFTLVSTATDNDESFIVTADTSSITNKKGKTIEFSFNGGEYGTVNSFTATAGQEVKASIRFAATPNTIASDAVTASLTIEKKTASLVKLYVTVDGKKQQATIKASVDKVTGYGNPTGKLTYEYSTDNGSNWSKCFETAKDISDEFTWVIPETAKNHIISIRATYSGDDNYSVSVSDVYKLDFEAPAVGKITVSRNNTEYSFTVPVSNEEILDGLKYYYLVSKKDENGYSQTAEDIISKGTAGILQKIADNGKVILKAVIDGSDFEEGAYVLQIVVADANGNTSNKVVSEYFMAPTIFTSSDIVASVKETLSYKSEKQTPSVTLSVQGTDEKRKEAVTTWLATAVTQKIIKYTFRRVKDGDGNVLTKEEAVSTFVTEAGTYEIFASANDADVAIANESLGTFSVGKIDVEEPDDIPELIVSLSDDRTKYVVEVDSLYLLNGNTDNIEYSFIIGEQKDNYEGVYTKNKTCLVEKGQKIKVKIRYAATNNTNTSTSVSSETIVMDDASSEPVITKGGTFTGTMTVTITGKNSNDEIYYTTDGSKPNAKSSKGIGTVKLIIGSTMTVRAVMSENGKVFGKTVSATYTKRSDNGSGSGTGVVIDTGIGNSVIYVTGITTNIKNGTLSITDTDKGSLSLIATLTPSNASNKAVKWKVSPEGIVELKSVTSKSGESITVTALNEGKALITAESVENSNIYTVINLTVKYNHTVHEWSFTGFDWSDPENVSGSFTCKSGSETVDAAVTRTSEKIDENTIAYTATVLVDPDGNELATPITETKQVNNSPDNGVITVEFADGINEFVYTGEKITPEVVVYNGSVKLVKDRDYKLKYQKNVNVTTPENVAKVIIEFKGGYKGKKEVPFYILPASIADAELITPIIKKGTSDYKVKLKVSIDKSNLSKTLKQGKDFVIDWKNTTGPNSKGKRKIAIRGINNYKSEKSFTLVYEDKVPKIKVNWDNKKAAKLVYDGKAVTVDKLFDEGILAVEGVTDRSKIHVTINGKKMDLEGNAIDAGTYYVYVYADGFDGLVKKNFKIVPNKNVEIEVLNQKELSEGYLYQNAGVTPIIELGVKDDGKSTLSGARLVLGKDYKITYSHNKKITDNSNNPRAKIQFMGNYKGIKAMKVPFRILPTLWEQNDVVIEMPDYLPHKTGKVWLSKYFTEGKNIKVYVNGILLKTNEYKLEFIIDGQVVNKSYKVDGGEKIYIKITPSSDAGKKYYGSKSIISEKYCEIGTAKEFNLNIAKISILNPYTGKKASIPYNGLPVTLGLSAEEAIEKGYYGYLSVKIGKEELKPEELENMIITYDYDPKKVLKVTVTITAKENDEKFYGTKEFHFNRYKYNVGVHKIQ